MAKDSWGGTGNVKLAKVQELLRESPEMGMITIKINWIDLNFNQVHIICKQRQAIDQASIINDSRMN